MSDSKYQVRQFGQTWTVGYFAAPSWDPKGEPRWHALKDFDSPAEAHERAERMNTPVVSAPNPWQAELDRQTRQGEMA